MRKYDRIIRFYDSWFDDWNDEAHEFSAEEKWQVVCTIVACQRQSSTEPLQSLPREIRRGLSLATLTEQVERMIEKAASCRERGAVGGRRTAVQTAKKSKSFAEVQGDVTEMRLWAVRRINRWANVIEPINMEFARKAASGNKEALKEMRRNGETFLGVKEIEPQEYISNAQSIMNWVTTVNARTVATPGLMELMEVLQYGSTELVKAFSRLGIDQETLHYWLNFFKEEQQQKQQQQAQQPQA